MKCFINNGKLTTREWVKVQSIAHMLNNVQFIRVVNPVAVCRIKY